MIRGSWGVGSLAPTVGSSPTQPYFARSSIVTHLPLSTLETAGVKKSARQTSNDGPCRSLRTSQLVSVSQCAPHVNWSRSALTRHIPSVCTWTHNSLHVVESMRSTGPSRRSVSCVAPTDSSRFVSVLRLHGPPEGQLLHGRLPETSHAPTQHQASCLRQVLTKILLNPRLAMNPVRYELP